MNKTAAASASKITRPRSRLPLRYSVDISMKIVILALSKPNLQKNCRWADSNQCAFAPGCGGFPARRRPIFGWRNRSTQQTSRLTRAEAGSYRAAQVPEVGPRSTENKRGVYENMADRHSQRRLIALFFERQFCAERHVRGNEYRSRRGPERVHPIPA